MHPYVSKPQHLHPDFLMWPMNNSTGDQAERRSSAPSRSRLIPTFLLVALCAWNLAAVLYWQRSEDAPPLMITAPSWLAPPGDRSDAVLAASVDLERHSVVDGEEDVAGLLLPPSVLASALVESKVPLTFEAQALISDHISHDLAREVVALASVYYKVYIRSGDLIDRANRSTQALFWAMWPDLPKLLQDKCLSIEVARLIRVRDGGGVGGFSSAVSSPDKTISISMHLPSWSVTLRLPVYAEGGCMERYRDLIQEVFESRTEK